ncbi:MAG: hypothetical protein QGI05_00220 [Candidatus Omnitrophota bacterium]|nr:hypothetical protein [Candidatus Omnitrophota bacterium]
MSAARRDFIKSWMAEGLEANGYQVDRDLGSSPSDRRDMVARLGDDVYLVSVHADVSYPGNNKVFIDKVREYNSQGVASVSVFDERVFLVSHRGRTQGIRLRGLEKVLAPIGPVAYFSRGFNEVKVVKFSSPGVTSLEDVERPHNREQEKFLREAIREYECSTVMVPGKSVYLARQDLGLMSRAGRKGGLYLADVVNHVAPVVNFNIESFEGVDEERALVAAQNILGGREDAEMLCSVEELAFARHLIAEGKV